MAAAAAAIRRLTPALKSLDLTRLTIAEVGFSTIRAEDQGGFDVPAELVEAAGAAHLSIGLSILVMLDDYEDGEPGSESRDTDETAGASLDGA